MRISVKIGLLTGLLAGAWMLAEYYFGLSHSVAGQYTGIVGLILLIFGICISISITKRKEFSGTIDFRNAVKAGVITASITAVLMAVFTYIFFEFVDTGFADYWVIESEK